jgi:hypothetical protein
MSNEESKVPEGLWLSKKKGALKSQRAFSIQP